MKNKELVAVTSRSFSKNIFLKKKLQEKFLNIRFNDEGVKLTNKKLINFLLGVKRAIIGLELIDEALLKNLPDLKVICKMGTGVDKIDFDALNRRQIIFTHTPGINKRSVSELVLGLMLTILRRLPEVNSIIKQGCWAQPTGQLLSNKIIGIIGFGAIGQDLAKLLSVFDCQCLFFDLHQYDVMSYAQQVNLETILKKSDLISLHIPLTSENYHLLGKKEFLQMKKGAILINTARGGLVDEDALYDSLKDGHLAGAGLDVFEHEPNVPHKLLELPNFFATSHIAGSTQEAIEAMGMMAIDNLGK